MRRCSPKSHRIPGWLCLLFLKFSHGPLDSLLLELWIVKLTSNKLHVQSQCQGEKRGKWFACANKRIKQAKRIRQRYHGPCFCKSCGELIERPCGVFGFLLSLLILLSLPSLDFPHPQPEPQLAGDVYMMKWPEWRFPRGLSPQLCCPAMVDVVFR